MATYKEIFQLAQDKDYDIYFEEIREGNYRYDYLVCMEMALLQKWLREIHRISVIISFASYLPDAPMFYADVNSLSSRNMGEELLSGFLYHKIYENALQEGIFEVLKLIK